MTALRVIVILCWIGCAIFMAQGAWAAATRRKVHRGDPMRLACFATSIVSIGFTARWLFAADNTFVWQLLYVLSAAVAIYIVKLGVEYGRGPLI